MTFEEKVIGSGEAWATTTAHDDRVRYMDVEQHNADVLLNIHSS